MAAVILPIECEAGYLSAAECDGAAELYAILLRDEASDTKGEIAVRRTTAAREADRMRWRFAAETLAAKRAMPSPAASAIVP